MIRSFHRNICLDKDKKNKYLLVQNERNENDPDNYKVHCSVLDTTRETSVSFDLNRTEINEIFTLLLNLTEKD